MCVSDESLLAELMPVIYHMMEHSGAGNGDGCHANQLPRLLDVIVNILTKRPPTDPVTDVCIMD